MTRAYLAASSALLVTVVAYGCGSSNHTISASGYDQSCSVDSDCAVVVSGCGCGEVSAAINVADVARYDADARRAEEGCPPSMVQCQPTPPAACTEGTCVVCPYGGCSTKMDAGLDAPAE